MFFRKGEALGSVQVDADPSALESKTREPEPAATSPEKVDEPEPRADKGSPEPPKHGDTKAVWIEWAVSQGMDRELAEDPSTTKQDLIDSYGG